MYNEEINLISPKKFSGLVAWYDASRITGLNNNDTVSQWDDLSGNDRHLTQSEPTKKPLYKKNITNGLPVVKFDGTNDTMTCAYGSSLSQPFTIFISARSFNTSSNGAFIDGLDVDHRIHLGAAYNDVVLFAQYSGTEGYRVNHELNPLEFNAITGYFNGASSSMYVSNSKLGCVNSGTSGSIGMSLGGRDFASRWGNCEIGEVIFYNKTMNAYELRHIQDYLIKKWGCYRKTYIAIDNMTRGDNSSLGYCDSNQTWNVGSYNNTTLPSVGILNNYGYFSNTTGTDSHAWIETGKSDCSICCNVRFAEDGDKGLLFRRVDANNYFFAHVDSSLDKLIISRCLDGVRSEIASISSATTSPGNEGVMRVILSGSSITAYTNQNYKTVTVTDTNLVTATKHGVYNASGNSEAFRYFTVEV